MTDKIMTKHPDPDKQGTNIDKDKYIKIKETILSILEDGEGISFSELDKRVKQKLKGNFDGSIGWYYTTVKLDLEARNKIRVDRSSSPQLIYLE